ncbi:MAG: hypothetical protein M3O09_17375 [Acidobacteriota bacterium]|nr:hypothetical protein [Acidobacteriota bacterium]
MLLKQLRERVTKLKESSADTEKALRELSDAETQLSFAASELEWLTLYVALTHIEFEPTPVAPFRALILLFQSLQVAGISAIWFMMRYEELRSLVGFILSATVVVVTTLLLIFDFRARSYDKSFEASQVAGMIQEIRREKGFTLR